MLQYLQIGFLDKTYMGKTQISLSFFSQSFTGLKSDSWMRILIIYDFDGGWLASR